MERLVHIFNPFTEREHRQFMNMVKQFRWTDKDNPFQTGTLTLNAITMSITLRDWANSCEVGETVELANSIYERLPDVFVGRR